MTFIKTILSKWKLFLTIFVIVGSFYTGYQYSIYKNDSEQLHQLLIQQQIMQTYLSRESEVAKNVEERLQQLTANETVIERERVQIVERPVYNNVCIDEDGLRLIKQYAEASLHAKE